MADERALDRTTGTFAGQHVLAEFDGIDARLLDDATFLQTALRRALDKAGATVCDMVSKRFTPYGVTVLALLSESHASLHTYPELGSVFVDVFTCGTAADPDLATRLLADALVAKTTRITSVARGKAAVTTTAATMAESESMA